MNIGETVHFNGSHIQLDEMTEKETEKYAFTLTGNMVSKTSQPIGMLVMDIEAEIIKEPKCKRTCADCRSDGK